MVSCSSTQNVHLCAWSQQDGTSQVVMEHLVFLIGQGVKEGSGTLVVSDVDDFVWVADEWLLNLL